MLAYDGLSDIGLEKEKQEDIIFRSDLGKGFSLFIIADGVGMVSESMNPAVIASVEIEQFLKRQVDYDADNFTEHIEHLMEESFLTANRVLGSFHLINEDVYKGFGCCVTACVIYDNDRKMTFAHCGNTRLHLIKANKAGEPIIKLLTIDHTKGFEQLALNKITEEEYLQGLDKMQLTSSLGVFADPEIQTSTIKFNPKNVLVLTTDGIHYPLWQRVIMELVVQSENTLSACQALIGAAKLQKYPDNMAVMTIFNE